MTTKVVGMGPDLALFLAVLGGLLASGDLVHWSIVCVDSNGDIMKFYQLLIVI